ncbi:hypothetical protein GYB61_09465 [bacterium]|nr:hypothetical protein [bacterium]
MMRLAAITAACVAACLVATWSPPASALALGEIELQSGLNEPLAARIPLRLSGNDELQSLRVSVAEQDAYVRSGLQYDAYLLSVELTVQPAVGAQPSYVQISSSKIAREPFLDLMVEARAQGNRILRNYTLLLDPPVLAAADGAQQQPKPAAPAPARSPGTSSAIAPPQTARPKPAAPTPASEPAEAALSVSSADPSYFQSGSGWVDADGNPVRRGSQAAAATPAGAKRYGPVGRKETLWSIAYALRPDSSITMDQMQLAIFRANPQAFDGNINLLLTGAMLNIPTAAAIRGVDPAAAKAEVARQRARYTPPADATMAAPAGYDSQVEQPADDYAAFDDSDFDDTDFDSAGSTADAPVADSGFDDDTVIDDDGFDADDAVADVDEFDTDETTYAPEPAEPETATQDSTAAAPSDQPNRPLSALERLRAGRNGTAPAQQPAAPPPATDTGVGESDDEADAEMVADEPDPVEPALAPAVAPVATADSDSSGGLPWALIAGLGAVLLAVLAFFGIRRRRAAPDNTPAAGMAVAAADDDKPADDDQQADDFDHVDTAVLDESEFGLGADAKPKPSKHAEPDVEHFDEPDGLAETAIFDEAVAETPEPEPTPEDTAKADAMAATMQFDANTISLDMSGDDPISEADVHMAYGATDEAASVMEAAVQAQPDNAAYRNKLAEIYFTGNQTKKFVAHARDSESVLKAGSGDGWQKLLILGQQIAPDEPLFAQADTAELQSADFDFGSDPDPLDDTGEDGESLALDIDEPASPTGDMETADSKADLADKPETDDGLEFDLGDLESPGDAEPAPDATAAPQSEELKAPSSDDDLGTDDDGLEFDFGDFDLSADVDETKPAPVEPSDDDNSVEFDLGDLEVGSDQDTRSPASEEPAPSAAEPKTDDKPSEDFDLGLELGDDSADAGGLDDVLGELGEFDLGDEPIVEPEGESNGVHAASLDALLGGDDGDGELSDPSDDDLSTKLDLARAYVDMGDKDLAESLLKDVVESGDETQKAEANDLMSKLAGG